MNQKEYEEHKNNHLECDSCSDGWGLTVWEYCPECGDMGLCVDSDDMLDDDDDDE